MSHIKDIFLENIFDFKLSEKEVHAYIYAFDFDRSSLIKAYQESIEKNFPNTTKAILKNEHLIKEFSFLGPTLEYFLSREEYSKLMPLYFKRLDFSYESVLEEIFRTPHIHSYKKRFGLAIKKYGTNVINNAWILKTFVDLPLTLDQFLALDQSILLPDEVISLNSNELEFLKLILDLVSLQKKIKLLTFFKRDDFIDIKRMFDLLVEHNSIDLITNKLKNELRVTSSFEELHEYFVTETFELENTIYSKTILNQEVLFLQGLDLLDLKIEVPITGQDLMYTGKIMHHCVGSYVPSVAKGHTQIINLTRNGKIYFTLELKKDNGRYEVTQFKGKYNSSTYEGALGDTYREELYKIISSSYSSNDFLLACQKNHDLR